MQGITAISGRCSSMRPPNRSMMRALQRLLLPVAIGKAGVVGDIDEAPVRHQHARLAQHGQPADPAIEHQDRAARSFRLLVLPDPRLAPRRPPPCARDSRRRAALRREIVERGDHAAQHLDLRGRKARPGEHARADCRPSSAFSPAGGNSPAPASASSRWSNRPCSCGLRRRRRWRGRQRPCRSRPPAPTSSIHRTSAAPPARCSARRSRD